MVTAMEHACANGEEAETMPAGGPPGTEGPASTVATQEPQTSGGEDGTGLEVT